MPNGALRRGAQGALYIKDSLNLLTSFAEIYALLRLPRVALQQLYSGPRCPLGWLQRSWCLRWPPLALTRADPPWLGPRGRRGSHRSLPRLAALGSGRLPLAAPARSAAAAMRRSHTFRIIALPIMAFTAAQGSF